MSSNLPLIHRSYRVLPFVINFPAMYGQGGHKLEINISPQQIYANSKGGLMIEGGVMSSEYGTSEVERNGAHLKWFISGSLGKVQLP